MRCEPSGLGKPGAPVETGAVYTARSPIIAVAVWVVTLTSIHFSSPRASTSGDSSPGCWMKTNAE